MVSSHPQLTAKKIKFQTQEVLPNQAYRWDLRQRKTWGKGTFQPALHLSNSGHSQNLKAKKIQNCPKLLMPLDGFL